MSESIVRNTMAKGIAWRVFGLILFTAIIPMVVTASLAFYEFNRSLEVEATKSMQAFAKDYGVRILTRLEQAAEKSEQIVSRIEAGGVEAISQHEYLLKDFEAIWVVGPDGLLSATISGPPSTVVLSSNDLSSLHNQKARILVTSQKQMLMLRLINSGHGLDRVLAFQLKPLSVWGPRDNLPYDAEFCVFTEDGEILNCTAEVDSSLHAMLLASNDGNRSIVFSELEHQGETQIAALWQLFLHAKFDAPALDIVAIQPGVLAMQSSTDIRRVLIPAFVLVLVLVGIISMLAIARGLRPLRNLTIAARQVAGGNLKSRVRVRSDDEFGWLGDAFNNMAERLGNQISTLEAMSGIDRLILTGTKVEEVSENVVRNLVGLTQCETAAVIAREPDSPESGKMISLHGDEFYHDRIDLPGDIGHEWCQPRQVSLDEVDMSTAPYAFRFESFEQKFVVLVPVVLNNDLKGVLLLGFSRQFDMSRVSLDRCVDLAGRFAVALASVEREEALYRQAHFDQLTGLPNRKLLKDRLNQNLASARLDNHSGAILFLDLDRFKEINDLFGHTVGDAVLKQSSQRIKAVVRSRDTVARLGGDEFVVLLPNVRNENIVRNTANRLLDSLGEAFTIDGTDHYLSASIGITLFPDDGATVETLLKHSDAAMYRAKEAGRGRLEFFSRSLNAESRRKISLERDLRMAFHDGQLEVHYQPQFDFASGEICGAEALLRWPHPVQGWIAPSEFIPLAEDSDLIVDIGSWVIEQACADLSLLLDKGLHPGSVSINVSGRQLADSSFTRTVLETIHKYNFHPGYMQLEVTETTVAQNREKAIAILESLRAEGVRIAIDDFGTGYSSLSYLQQMPLDVIKIDKSFIDRIGSSVTSDNICRTIIKMAEQLGKKSIAEGVEEEKQVDFLRQNGCDFAQGFYYSKALPPDEFLNFVEKQDFHTRRRKALEII